LTLRERDGGTATGQEVGREKAGTGREKVVAEKAVERKGDGMEGKPR